MENDRQIVVKKRYTSKLHESMENINENIKKYAKLYESIKIIADNRMIDFKNLTIIENNFIYTGIDDLDNRIRFLTIYKNKIVIDIPTDILNRVSVSICDKPVLTSDIIKHISDKVAVELMTGGNTRSLLEYSDDRYIITLMRKGNTKEYMLVIGIKMTDNAIMEHDNGNTTLNSKEFMRRAY
jgi:hypothetical protein